MLPEDPGMMMPEMPPMGMPPPDMGMPMPPRGNGGDGFQQALKASVKRPDPFAEVVNLASHLKEQELKDIAGEVIEDYEQDEESRTEWLALHAQWVRLYFLRDKPKNPPWPGSSAESMPILVEGCNQFHSRAYKSFFATEKFVAATPIGKASQEDQERAERVGRYMSWQLSIQDRSYRRNKDRLLRALPLHGSVFTKVYRDPLKRRNVVENVRALDMVVPYGAAGIDIEDLERKTQIISLPLRKGKELSKGGKNAFFIAEPEAYMSIETNPVQEAVDDATGMSGAEVFGRGDKGAARILEQHRYLDLDGDGVSEPYIVWVDYQTKKVLRVAVRYDIGELGEPLANKGPVEYFTHYVYLENPDGVLGLGLGHMTGSMNSAVNKILRQCIDAGSLQNIRTALASQSLGIRKGNIDIKMGQINVVEGMIDDMRKGLLFIDHPGPSQALIGLMQTLIQRADRLNMVTEGLTGTQDKVVQPTTTLALIEQALTTFSAVGARVYASLESELMKLYRLNGMYIGDDEYFSINDVMGLEEGVVSKDDFLADLQIMPVFDLKDATESAKMARAEKTMQFSMANPLIQSSPDHLYEASKRYLMAHGEPNIDLLLPNPEILAQKEQEMKEMEQGQQDTMMQQTEMQTTQKAQADQAAAELKAAELGIKGEALDIERMKAQAEITHKTAALEVKATQAQTKQEIEKRRAAAEIDQEDQRIDGDKIKSAASYETAIRKLINEEGKKS